MNKTRALLAASLLTLLATPSLHAFTHPGIPLTKADLDTIKANLNNEPWKSAYAELAADGHSSLNYTMQGPFATVSRNPDQNRSQWENDMQAIFNLSCMFYLSGSTAYAQKAHDILIAWATTNTSFGGIEGSFELGDYAFKYAGGADILRGCWSGWTASDTTTCQNYFANVYWPNLAVPGPTMTGSQGIEQLVAALAIAIFNDDVTKFNQVLSAFLTDGDSGLRDTYPNGEVGDTGRDQGHTSLFVLQSAMIGEMFWKQGTDVFSLLDNRILAIGEYYARYNLPGSAPAYVALGAPFWGVFQSISGTPRSSGQSRLALNIIHGAYSTRKGISAPWVDAYCNDQSEDGNSFLFRKSGDVSTASIPTAASYPSTASLTTGLTNSDLNGCAPAGSGVYASGTWTLTGGYNGVDPWNSSAGNDTVHFAYKTVTGDFSMVAKVASVSSAGSNSAKAGIMLRDSLGTASNRFWVAITPGITYERALRGWTNLPYGSNAQSMASSVSQIPYWVKLERVGNRLQAFTSLEGGSWSPAATADFANLPGTIYLGLFTTSFITGSSITAKFTNVYVTGGDGGAPASTPAAPFAVYASAADTQVVLRWNESFGATSYNVKRSTVNGSAYATLANVSNTTFTDTTASNGTTYYYVLTAVNSAGESGNSQQDSAAPAATLVNVAVGGTANASSGTTGTEGCAQAFNSDPSSKWLGGFSGGAWLQYDFGSNLSQAIKGYAITSANDVPARDPSAWQFQGSNDASAWTTLDTQSNQSFPYRYQTLKYLVSNTSAYRYYRLNITANSGTNSVQLGELALLTNQGRTIPNGTYRLLNRKSNKALETAGGGTALGTSIDQYSYSGGSGQKWTFTDQGNGQYQILGIGSGYVLEVPGATTNNGTVLDIWSWNGGNNPHQQWTAIPTGNGFYKLLNVNSGKAADVNGGSTADGASVIQWPYQSGMNQQWSISVAP